MACQTVAYLPAVVVVVPPAIPTLEQIQLNDRIMRTPTFNGTVVLWQRRAYRFNSVNVSTLFHRISQLFSDHAPSQDEMTTIRQMIQWTITDMMIFSMNSRSLACTVSALSKLGIHDPSLMGKFTAVITLRRQEFEAPALTQIFCAYTKLGIVNRELFKLLADVAYARRFQFNADGISNTLWALQTADYRHEQLMHGLAEVARKCLNTFTLQQCLNLFVAYQKLNCRTVRLQERLYDRIVANVERLSIEEFAQFRVARCALSVFDAIKVYYPSQAKGIVTRYHDGKYCIEFAIPGKNIALEIADDEIDEEKFDTLISRGWNVCCLSARDWFDWGSSFYSKMLAELIRAVNL